MLIIDYIKELCRAFKRRSKEAERLKEDMKSNDTAEFSIYGNLKKSESAKRHFWIHHIFKYKIMLPLLYAIEKNIKKHYYEPTDKWYDDMFNLLNTSVEEGIYDWAKYYIGINKDWTEKDIQRYVQRCPFMRLYKMGQLGIVGNDNAYRELENIIGHKFGQNYIKQYANKKELNHLLYTSPTIYDINYYYAGYDLLNRYFIKSDKTGEEKILATESLPVGHTKIYFTINLQHTQGWTNLFKEMQQNIEKIPKRYIVTHIHLAAQGINNMEVIVFDSEMKPTEEERDYRGRENNG